MPRPRRSESAGALRVGITLWRDAQRWRRRIEAELTPLGVSLAQWLVLEAIDALIAETNDAVSQNEIAAYTELDRMAVSRAMKAFAQKGWVDRAPDLTGRAYRILLTKRGRQLLAQSRARIEAASARNARP